MTPTNPISWAYGITTVPERSQVLLPLTLKSLTQAGFPKPRLFVDAPSSQEGLAGVVALYRDWDLPLTIRYPRIYPFANWALGLAELYAREPQATYYVMFQDDMITYSNLRQYLEHTLPSQPANSYFNLYTFRRNERVVENRKVGWVESGLTRETHPRHIQTGEGALALVFSREGVVTLLTHLKMVERPMHPRRGWRNVDGGVVNAMNAAGWRETIHNPSLVQHIGDISTLVKNPNATLDDLNNRPGLYPINHKWGANALTFRGEEFDALQLLDTH